MVNAIVLIAICAVDLGCAHSQTVPAVHASARLGVPKAPALWRPPHEACPAYEPSQSRFQFANKPVHARRASSAAP